MDTKALRQKILDLAIRGKLVPQDPNDEPASVLLERIRAEKQQMVKDGKLKAKDVKNDTVIFVGEDNLHYEKFADGKIKCIEDEIPFDLPEGWEWCRLCTLSEIITKGASPKWQGVSYQSAGVLFITSENVGVESLLLDSPKFVDEKINEIQPRSILKKHDVLTNIVGASIGRACEYTMDCSANTNQAVAIIRLVNLNLVRYIVKCLNSQYCLDLMFENQVNVARANLSLSSLAYFLIPVPPKEEINRINAQLEQAFIRLDFIEAERLDLQDALHKMKSYVLDLAIRGQLVPQNPDDEPASALLERIREEKERLIKEEETKRDKRESVIFKGEDNSYYETIGSEIVNIDDVIPFDVPEGWAVERLKNIYVVNPKNTIDDDTLVSFVPMALVDDQFSGKFTYEEKPWKECRKGFTHFADGDVGFAKISPCFENRKSAVFTNLKNGYGAGTTELFIMRSYANAILPEYTIIILKSGYFIRRGIGTFSGVVGQQRVDKNVIFDTIVLIPPRQEQKRISEKVRQLFSLLESIETALT